MLGGFLHICTCTCTIYCGLWPPDNTSCTFITWYQSPGLGLIFLDAQLIRDFSTFIDPDLGFWPSPAARVGLLFPCHHRPPFSLPPSISVFTRPGHRRPKSAPGLGPTSVCCPLLPLVLLKILQPEVLLLQGT
jgi:hypothetical protein